MKIVKENNFSNIFPMKIKCKRVVDRYGLVYGEEKDFCGSELEIEADDIKKYRWSKYPDYSGIDYGVICPVCGEFISINEDSIPSPILKKPKKFNLDKIDNLETKKGSGEKYEWGN